MSSQSSFLNWLRHPASILLLIALVLMFVVMLEQKDQQSQIPKSAVVNKAPTAESMLAPQPAKTGGELPRIVRQFSTPSTSSAQAASRVQKPAAGGSLQAPELGSLLGRLEDKVKAEPTNMANRLLLAQTYNELGLADKALSEARAARTQDPNHQRAKLVLASILSGRDNAEGLNEAKGLLQELESASDIKPFLIAMYLGDTHIRLGDHKAALNYWRQAVETMPATDNRRQTIEKRIQDLSAKATP